MAGGGGGRWPRARRAGYRRLSTFIFSLTPTGTGQSPTGRRSAACTPPPASTPAFPPPPGLTAAYLRPTRLPPPRPHLDDGAGPHRERGEVPAAVDGHGLPQDLVQPLQLLPRQDAEAVSALLRGARSGPPRRRRRRHQHRRNATGRRARITRKQPGNQPEVPGREEKLKQGGGGGEKMGKEKKKSGF